MEESPRLGHLTEGQQAAIQKLIRDFSEVINPRLGLTDVLEYEIPVARRQWKHWMRCFP